MELFVDADGCPVTDLAVRLAGEYGVPCTLFCDTAHQLDRPGVRTIVVSKGPDSADFALVNRVRPGDLVVTQDYGLAAMCLSRGAIPIRQDGLVYTAENIDGLLTFRAAAARVRHGGGRLKGPRRRTAQEDRTLSETLDALLREGRP